MLVKSPQYDTISFTLVCVRYLIGTLSIIHISLSRFLKYEIEKKNIPRYWVTIRDTR